MEPIKIKSDDVTRVIIDKIRTSPDNHFTLLKLREEASKTVEISKSKFYRVTTKLIQNDIIKRTTQSVNRHFIFSRNPVAMAALIIQHYEPLLDKVFRTIQEFPAEPGERFSWLQIYHELQKETPNVKKVTVKNYFYQHLKTGRMVEDGRTLIPPIMKLYKLITPSEKEEPQEAKQTITRDEAFDTIVERLNELTKLKQEHNKSLVLIKSLRGALQYAKEQSKDEIKATNSWKQCIKVLEEDVVRLTKIKERNEDIGRLLKEKSEADEQTRSLANENYKLKRQLSNPGARIDAIKMAHKEEIEKLNKTITKLRKYGVQKEKELNQLKETLKEFQEERSIRL